jgi:hypothetical protein
MSNKKPSKLELQVLVDTLYDYLKDSIQDAENNRKQHYTNSEDNMRYGTAFELGYLQGKIKVSLSLLEDLTSKKK